MSAILEFIKIMQDWQHRGEAESHGFPTFLRTVRKRQKGYKEKKSFKGKTIKISPRLKCYYFSQYIGSRIQKYFSVFHKPSILKSILAL